MNVPNHMTPKSILGRLGILMGTIVIFAIVSIMISTIFTEMSAGKARAINIAGSLRMHSYLLASQLTEPGQDDAQRTETIARSVQAYETRLNNPLLLAGLNVETEKPLYERYRRIHRRWEQTFKPLALAAATDEAQRITFIRTIGDFVSEIDEMVHLMEQELEDKIQWLRLVQGVSLFAIVVVVLVTMYLMHMQVLIPLNNLLDCARAVRKGDFRISAEHTGPDELGQLGDAFNVMVKDLSHMYANLEARVEEKTEELARTNRSLELLYDTTRTLLAREITNEALMQVLRQVEQVVGAASGAIYACNAEQQRGLPLAADISRDGNRPTICSQSDCARCIGDGAVAVHAAATADSAHIVSIPLTDRGRSYGVMPLAIPRERQLAPWQLQLLEAVGRHIGAALAMAQRNEERHRLALFEERSVIARELHDSLAQSLSYLKIQVARLQSLLDKAAPAEQTRGVVGELKTGLNNAYRQLRELLTTFRLRMDGRGLQAALEDTVRECRSRTGLAITLRNRLIGVELASNEEIHVLQVIREALSNVEHHAHARQVDITLERLPDNRVRVRVDDDGVGITSQEAPTHHYGLVIMRDRAHSLKGELSIHARAGGGTRVELEFTPATPFRELPQTA